MRSPASSNACARACASPLRSPNDSTLPGRHNRGAPTVLVSNVTHHECIATLLAGPEKGGPARPATGARAEARAHIARCSDCWEVLRLLYELAEGGPPADAERMPALFGCAPVQDELYLLAGLNAAEIRATHPGLVRHLGWCFACRDRLAELLIVERAAASGEFGPPLLASASRWRLRAARAGETIHEAVGRVVVQVRRAAAAFAAVPEGFTITALGTPAGAYRGPGADAGQPAPGQQLHFELPDSSLAAELTLEPRHDDRVGVAVRFSGGEASGLSVHLHEVQGGRTALVARHAVRGANPVVFKSLGAGHYVVEIRERERARRFQLRFDVETPA